MIKSEIQKLASLVLLGTLVGCADDTLPRVSKLGNLRILGIQASQPEVNPGTTLTLTSIVSDFDSAGARSITEELVACEDPGVSAGANPSCEGSSTEQVLVSRSFTPAASTYTEARPAVSVTVPSTLLSNRSVFDQANGISYLAQLRLTTSTGVKISAIKRILVSLKSASELNTNPTLDSIQNQFGHSITSLPLSSGSLKAIVSGQQNYSLYNAQGKVVSKTEILSVSWFTNDGSYQFERTQGSDPNYYTIGNINRSDRFFAVILRDDRGGLAYRILGP